jgi:hypothetical protein
MTMRQKFIVIAAAPVLCLFAVSAADSQERFSPKHLFETSDQCLACHNGLATPSGQDASIGTRWRSTIMAHAAKDPYWLATVRRETMEHPAAAAAIEDKCSTCHMPMARFAAAQQNQKGAVLSRLSGGHIDLGQADGALAEDGVSCSVCHQIDPQNLGLASSFDGGFRIDTTTPVGQRKVYGPFEIADGTAHLMSSATGFVPTKSEHLRKSEMCATCHTLYTHALDEKGNEVAQIAEQAPYLEWLHSDYKDAMSCQDCHMAKVPEDVPISSVLGKPREGVVQHLFKGGNFMLLRMLAVGRALLGVKATAGELDENLRITREHLSQSAANLAIDAGNATQEGSRLSIPVVVQNLAGHKLPTAYPSRRVWLHVVIKDRHDSIVFESGALREDGSIAGNDNDEDPLRYEPHYDRIDEPGQVQIYESIMGDVSGKPTTGLLRGASYLKDNRVLPMGFDKTTADADVAVAGRALEDPGFEEGRHTVRYIIETSPDSKPYTVTAQLWYQPISHRWATNLGAFEAPEPARFMKLYSAIPGKQTAEKLASVTRTVE